MTGKVMFTFRDCDNASQVVPVDTNEWTLYDRDLSIRPLNGDNSATP
jgi:hypothetical protein